MTGSVRETSTRMVRCPACGGLSPYTPDNRWRPFCSERCKLHDLGAWASERFRVEAEGNDRPDIGREAGPQDR